MADSQKHLLLVEDEPATCAAVRAVLESAGATVTAVSSAADAIDAFNKEAPDVILPASRRAGARFTLAATRAAWIPYSTLRQREV